ncbi:type III secretion system protein [Geobacillus subterraneus]|uniref:Type III secretion system protein n=2 Tax=Geobacillus TaxID=129337 RepID=A0ABN4NHB8_9BACL|nr:MULTISPECIES: EscU/YscU/HrcU family type III secretion system export apparatus switch protein [Geobacillus]AMX84054.1 type III secretion system protein [Geobacillus subterraneus]KZS26847.1 type III secretion system protein [Geobacillus subterraneus]OXB88262.1 type III secretion system protein [Geobacillus uzenensis]QIZ67313.1 type III secretion system protein [Geobacillus subterraneus]WPZ19498.1 EscU/YscU/HrcU family type III secretion system export apparatus switch protein [Geobacillus sub
MNEERKKAVALSYDAAVDEAPVVKAKGSGEIAEAIIAAAEQYGVPVRKDPSLVELLSEVEINEAIPEGLYALVAELFAFLYQLDRAVKEETLGEG